MKLFKNAATFFLLFIALQYSLSSCAQRKNAAGSKQPLVVFVTGDHEYSGETTLPFIAAELEKNYGFRTKFLKSSPDHNSEENIPGLEALKEADLAVFFLRWRRLPADQIQFIEDYLKSAKPLIGFRTTTHAFNYPKGHALEKWNAFGEMAFNAPPGWGGKANHTHYGHNSSTDVSIIPAAASNPVLTGVGNSFHARSWLYKVLPDYPSKQSTLLLMGRSVNPDKKDAFDNPVAWTGKNGYGANFFITTLGHPEDFDQEPFQRLIINAVHWAAGKPVPKKWAGKMAINVPYRQ
ncbi:MAG TPA: ThuA domain-containing protein [Chitinophagaceae bacterium]|jgi:type 1 glutamine amidotransferase|nr:ThuA domain-containing protein [Chitinophagaceae bacterium]